MRFHNFGYEKCVHANVDRLYEAAVHVGEPGFDERRTGLVGNRFQSGEAVFQVRRSTGKPVGQVLLILGEDGDAKCFRPVDEIARA